MWEKILSKIKRSPASSGEKLYTRPTDEAEVLILRKMDSESDVPTSVREWFTSEYRRWDAKMHIDLRTQATGEVVVPRWLDIFNIHDNSVDTYIARQRVTDDKGDYDLVYIADLYAGKIVGRARMVNALFVEHDSQKPIFEWSVTDDDFDNAGKASMRNKGLGERRMVIANAVAQKLWDRPLFSSPLISDEARGLWEKLCALNPPRAKKGQAQDGTVKYEFLA